MHRKKVNATQYRAILVNGYATENITEDLLAQWAGNLTYVSYYSYGFTMDGDLLPINDDEIIQDAYNVGVAPLMVITPLNEFGEYDYQLVKTIMDVPLIRDRLINNIILTVMEKEYYGAVFNFGYIAEEDKEEFVILISKTTTRLNRKGRLGIVSLLMPGENDAGINYMSLGKIADFIELRIFQWENESAALPPNTTIDEVHEMLTSVIQKILPQKILLGIRNSGNVDETERTKLELVNKFGLAGISIWTIMTPFPAGIEMLNGLYTVYKV